MPGRERHKVVSLGSVSGTASTPEVDVSSADRLILFFTRTAGTVKIEAAPEPFGESANWYQWGRTTSGITGSAATKIPIESYGPHINTAHRIRITGVAGSANFSGIYVELVRSIA